MLPQLRNHILSHWTELCLDSPEPRDLVFLIQGTGVSKVCCYVFVGREAHPRWVAKMARAPRENWVLAQEYELVQQLRYEGSDFVRSTIPRPLMTTSISGHFVEIEAYFPGRPMYTPVLHPGRGDGHGQMDHLDRAIQWLLQCQKDTLVQRRVLTDKQLSSYLLSPIRQLEATAQLTQSEIAYLDSVVDRFKALAPSPLPLVFNHGDFRPENILMDGDSMQVLDWEFGSRIAPPLLDVFGLLSRSYARRHHLKEIDGYLEDYLQAFDAVFLRGGSFAEIARGYVAHSCEVLGIADAWIEPLFALFLVIEANKYHAFLNRCAQRGYVYLLRSRDDQIGGSYRDQLARQKNVWLLGHLAGHREELAFVAPTSGSVCQGSGGRVRQKAEAR